MNLAGRGVEVRLRGQPGAAASSIDDLAPPIDARTRMVSLSFVEFASGFRNDLDAVGALCRERGVLFFVDAIQGLGVLPARRAADADRLPGGRRAQVAARAGGGRHLLRPPRAGRAAAPGRRRLEQRRRRPAISRSIDFRLKPHAGRWESGTLNVAGITGAGGQPGTAAGDRHRRDRAARAGADRLPVRAGQRAAGLEVFSSRAAGETVGHRVAGGARGRRCRRWCARCRERGHRHQPARPAGCASARTVYNTTEEIDRLVLSLLVTDDLPSEDQGCHMSTSTHRPRHRRLHRRLRPGPPRPPRRHPPRQPDLRPPGRRRRHQSGEVAVLHARRSASQLVQQRGRALRQRRGAAVQRPGGALRPRGRARASCSAACAPPATWSTSSPCR